MRKLSVLFYLVFQCSLIFAVGDMTCIKTCPDSGKTIFVTPCHICIDGYDYIDCDGRKSWCPKNNGEIIT